DRALNTINLENDAATAWSEAVIGSSAILQNSQCTVNVGGAGVVANGNTLTWNLPLTFKPAFSGSKTIYQWAGDVNGVYSGWQTRGNWTVPGAAATADSVTPNAGSGSSQAFMLQYSSNTGALTI